MLPFVLNNNIVTEKELTDILQWYESQLSNSQDRKYHPHFYDWVVCTIRGDKKAEGFLRFYNIVLEDLLFFYNNNLPPEIRTKIRNSIMTKPLDQYKDSMGELLAISYLLKKTKGEFDFLGLDYQLGNEKDADIAFKKKSSIQLIEIKNKHHLVGKDLIEAIKNGIKGKLVDKTKQIDLVEDHFRKNYPNCEITLSILFFIWEDYADIANNEFSNDELKKEMGDDFLPPITVISQEIDNGEFIWQICDLESAISLYKKESNVEKTSDVSNPQEAVLTRRSFFKKTAGMVLPMLGALLLSGVSSFSNAKESLTLSGAPSTPMNCGGSCSGSCSGDCSGSCDTGCSGGCGSGCSRSCSGSCGQGCSEFCTSSCKGSCKAQCRDGCTSCKGTCTQQCLSGCGRLCSKNCSMGCETGCEGCRGSCKGLCKESCKGSCNGCSGSCGIGCDNACIGNCGIGCGQGCESGCTYGCKFTCHQFCSNMALSS